MIGKEKLQDILTEFDEFGYLPTTLCPNPESASRDWKVRLCHIINQIEMEARENAVKEFAEKLKETVFDYLGVKTIEEADKLSLFDSTLTYDVVTDRIDELLKEYEK